MALKPGNQAPRLDLQDIDGHSFNTDDYQHSIRIFSFADRNSSGRLMEWLTDANIEIKKTCPSAKLTYINFADVSLVPRMMQKVVNPILRTINSRSLKQLQHVYDEAGINEGREDIVFHLIPDWKGDFLKQFAIKDASNYHVWIERGGVIDTSLHEPTADISERFVDCICHLLDTGPG